jgi:hypothetical protein
MRARRERLRVGGDRVVLEFAKISFANARDYVPRKGQELDIHRLNADKTAAIKSINLEETYDVVTREVRRRIQIRLHDKIAALTALAKHLGIFAGHQVAVGTIEHVVLQMTPAERVARVEQLRVKARTCICRSTNNSNSLPMAGRPSTGLPRIWLSPPMTMPFSRPRTMQCWAGRDAAAR